MAVEEETALAKEQSAEVAEMETFDDAMETFDEEEQEKSQPPVMVERDCEIQEVEEEDEEALLTEDAYSLLYTSAPCSRTALFAWFSITLQGGMLLVTFLDLFDTSPEGNDTNGAGNRMEIPAGSTVQVMIAQFLGMLLTAMVMAAEGDFVIGITQLIKGYDPKIREKSPHASWIRWLMTGLLQSFFGIILLVDSFILSMQSATVIDLSLNLTALHFIQEIDNMSFALGLESGLLGSQVEEDCEHVKNLKGYSTPQSRRTRLLLRRWLIALMTISLLIPYFFVIVWQSDGHYMCTNLYIQFGDEYIPEMAHYNGIFRSQGNSLKDRKGQRNYYIDDSNTFKVAYCNSENYWGISRLDDNECNYIFRSAETETFDIIEAAEENWMVQTPSTGDIAVDWLKIVCNDCTEDTCSAEHGTCSEAKDECLCHEGRYGTNCQFESTWECSWIALDQRTRDGLAAIPGTSSFLEREYTYIPGLAFYDRPIYAPIFFNETVSGVTFTEQVDSFIIFTGRRWVLYAIPDENLAAMVEKTGVPSNWSFTEFSDDFDRYSSHPTYIEGLQALTWELLNYFPIFFSSPLNYGETNGGFDPSKVTWMHATIPYNTTRDPAKIMPAYPDEEQPVSAKFLCSNCNGDDNFCLNGGVCHPEYATCVCSTFYKGYQCERVKDCINAGGCSGAGICNTDTKTCDCEEGSYGSLCQLGTGASAVPDLLLCNECRISSGGYGHCNNTFSQECTCEEGWSGRYCNETR